MKNKRLSLKHFIIYSLIFIAVISLYSLSTIYASKNFIEVTTYEYPSDKISKEVNLIIISDAHAHEFGSNNIELIDKVKNEKPDAILLDGDIINFYEKSTDYLSGLVSSLKDIAPVYYTIGNHEEFYMANNQVSIESVVEAAGGIYLDQEYEDIVINEQKIRLGGLYDYAYNNLQVPIEQYHEKGSYLFLKDYVDTDSFTLLMSHRPESFINEEKDARWPIDLVISGHEHGGQIRLPLVGGFYSTHLGLFSEFLDSYHNINGITILVSRGLGTHESSVPPRMYNIPEIVKLKITKKTLSF
ncbi:metallophosphoesterase [Amedibacillus sp. YH-ame10]